MKKSNFTVVQLVLMDETGDSYYRMRWPARDLASQDKSWRIINLDARSPRRYQFALEADLLILYQSNDIDLLPIIQKRRTLGRRTIVEYNDNFYAPPAASPVAQHWRSPLLWQAYEAFIKQADGLIVTGQGLKDLFKDIASAETYIIENHLPFKPNLKPKDAKNINIGWAGSIGHAADLLAIVPTIRKIMESYSDVNFHLMGNSTLPEILNIPKERLHFTAWGGMNEYYNFLDKLNIGLAPLLDTPYNRCRSDIKALEISSAGALPVLTDLTPYKEFIKNTGAPSFSSLSELSSILSEYVKDREKLTKTSESCFQYVANRRVGIDRLERYNIYSNFMPKELSQFSWNLDLGYHEIIDPAQEETPTSIVIKEIEKELKNGDKDRAKIVLERGLAENEHRVDLHLIKATRFFESEAHAHTVLSKAEKLYPNDLRIIICKALLTKDNGKRLKIWNEVIEKFERGDSNYKNYFSTELVRRFTPEMHKGSDYKMLGEKILTLVPHAIQLRLAMLELNRSDGEIEKALDHINFILQFWRDFSFNQGVIKDLPESYLISLQDSMRAHLSDKMSEC